MDMLMKQKQMEFKFEILKSIYIACKANKLQKLISPNGTSYCVSFESDSLIISSKTGSYELDTGILPFLESKIGISTKNFARSDSKTSKPLFFMVWIDFDIDQI